MTPEQIELFKLGYAHGRMDERNATRDFAKFVDAELRALQRDIADLGQHVHRYERIEKAAAAERDPGRRLH